MIDDAVVETLITWTPYLFEGFGWNMLISLTAGLIGLAIGAPLAFLRHSRRPFVASTSHNVSAIIHNLPTFALIFYTAMMLPNELAIPGTSLTIGIPAWFKAALALAAMQIGYVSENLAIAIGAWHEGNRMKAMLFIPGWINGFVITVIASSNASVVGVNELISRCNNVINASGHTDLMIPIYIYGSLFFLCFCFPLSLAINRVKRMMTRKMVGE